MKESIDRMTLEISTILNQRVHSIWLYGSVVLNDFHLGFSDIDFIAFTEDSITAGQADRLLLLRQRLSQQFPDNPYYQCFEGVIVNLNEYLEDHFTRLVYWGTSGQRIKSSLEADVFAKYQLAKYSKPVYGEINREMFTVPSKEELTAAVRKHYEAIRTYAVQTTESLYSCGWLLDIARCIYTLRHNNIIGKTQAGLWALDEHIFFDEGPLKKALMIRRNPLEYKRRDDIKLWLSGLGPSIQQYADVLENELKKSQNHIIS